MAKDIVYWDANCFLALLNNEAENIKCCQGVMKKAEAGGLVIVTSALTLIEVIKMKGKPKLTSAVEKRFAAFSRIPLSPFRMLIEMLGLKHGN